MFDHQQPVFEHFNIEQVEFVTELTKQYMITTGLHL